MIFDYIKIVVTVSIAVAGWSIAHYFTVKRDVSSKRRELVTQHLIEAYQILTNDISHRELTKEREEKLENMLTQIQLFGSIEQIRLAKELIDGLANKKSFELDPLINNLRDDLRKQLNLLPVSGNARWLRFNKSSSCNKAI